jgi:hypothetical protein
MIRDSQQPFRVWVSQRLFFTTVQSLPRALPVSVVDEKQNNEADVVFEQLSP